MLTDIWASFRRLPAWVQIWVAVILVPVNAASVGFWPAPHGPLLTCLAIGGMIPNLPIMLAERGLSRAMAIPHVLLWTPLVGLLIWIQATGQVSGGQVLYLWLLLFVDAISLGFDYVDAYKWLRGERAIA
jgi:hypothetical protein